MGIPQIIVIILSALNALTIAYMHGKPKTGEYNIFSYLVSLAVTYWILIAGGFFN